MRSTACGSIACIGLGILIACGGKPLPDWKTAPSPTANTKRVDHLERISNNTAWQRSPYSRVDDVMDLPIYLIIAEDYSACVAPAADWTIAARGDLYPCPGRWRIARTT